MKSLKRSIMAILAVIWGFSGLAQVAFYGQSVLLDSVNTPIGEEFLVLHPSGNRMAFTRVNYKQNTAGTTDPGDIWVSDFKGQWHRAVNLKAVNDGFFASPIGYSADGRQFLYNYVQMKGGTLTTEVRMYDGNSIQPLEIQYFKNKSTHQSGCLSVDQRYLILAMEGTATYGVEDLYVCEWIDGRWSAPKNLGQTVNTRYQEITPFLAADNKTLFFASNGRGGQGSFDIYYTIRQDDSWRHWSTPVNLGTAVNTPGSETSFSFLPDAAEAYFVSTQHSDGYGDIRKIRIQPDITKVQDSVQAIVVKEKPEVKVTGIRVLNAKDEMPIRARVILKFADGTRREANPSQSGILELPQTTGLEVEVKGFLPTVADILPDNLTTVRLEPLEVGRTIRLEHVLFYRATANIIESSFRELDLVVDMLKDNPEIKILLKGHTDISGDAQANLQLSEERVKAVKDYLVRKGIKANRISGRGFGSSQPIATSDTEESRMLNRRVEFEVVK
jgi:OmpA-OmpF porin, OOP family